MAKNNDKSTSQPEIRASNLGNQENPACHAVAPSAELVLVSTLLKQQSAREQSLAGALHRLAAAMEAQNRGIADLLGQTAALVDALVSRDEEDREEEEGDRVYLDGTRVRTS